MFDYVVEYLKGVCLFEVEFIEDEMIICCVNYYWCNGYEVLDKIYV